MQKKHLYIFFLLGACRILMVAGFLNDVPHIDHRGFEFHMGGDQHAYFAMAKAITEGRIHPDKRPWGYPLLIAPLVECSGAEKWQDVVKPVVCFNTLLAIGSIFLVGRLSAEITNSGAAAAAAAAVWTVFPYIMYAGLGLDDNAAVLRKIYISHAMWFPMLSDDASTFFVLLVLYLCVRQSNACMVGLAAGFCVLLRYQNAVLTCFCQTSALALRQAGHKKAF